MLIWLESDDVFCDSELALGIAKMWRIL
jgi:hypothetical protein